MGEMRLSFADIDLLYRGTITFYFRFRKYNENQQEYTFKYPIEKS